MSAFPHFSNFSDYVIKELNSRKDNIYNSDLNCWVRAISAVSNAYGKGMILTSNPNHKLFNAAGDPNFASTYGGNNLSGTVGTTWANKGINAQPGVVGRPSPIITNFEVDEGSGNISRKATFTIRCFTPEQLEVITSYYLEPGFTIFLEWGWNTAKGLANYMKSIDENSIGAYQSFTEVNKRRAASGGKSDVFLGFITGGTINSSEIYWDVVVKCTGFVELPAYFMVADNSQKKVEEANKNAYVEESLDFASWETSADVSKGNQRFRLAFNDLPSNKKTQLVKDLDKDPTVANMANFINYDKKITDKINSTTDGSWFFGIGGGKVEQKDESGKSTTKVKVADGTKLCGPEKFMRFGTLAKILNTIAYKGYVIGGKNVKYQINTKDCVCGAFEKIFSTDKSKLFIPNPNTPQVNYVATLNADGKQQEKFDSIVDNSVELEKSFTDMVNETKSGGSPFSSFKNSPKVTFPSPYAISNGVVNGTQISYIDKDAKIEGVNKEAGKWGFLEDLYVNMDFVKPIIETKNFLIKDALYQILNGMSSAAGSIWDFQIVESTGVDGNVELKVVDMNFVSDVNSDDKIYTFYMNGASSIFLEASFDMDINGAIMNQVIGSRLGAKSQASLPSYEGKLFSTGNTDLVLQKIETTNEASKKAADDANQANSGNTSKQDDVKDKQQKDLALFLNKCALYPRVEQTEADAAFGADPYKTNYLAAISDLQLFEGMKLGHETIVYEEGKEHSVLLPIKFKFTIQGVSGIKRGDKFKVSGIPKQYSDAGFFQVLSVKQILDGMMWKTEVEGGFRQSISKPKK